MPQIIQQIRDRKTQTLKLKIKIFFDLSPSANSLESVREIKGKGSTNFVFCFLFFLFSSSLGEL